MDTTSNLLVEDCNVDSSVRKIIQEYGINEKHLEHVIDTHDGKLHIIEEAKIYEEALAQREYDLKELGCATRYLADSYGKHWRFVRKSGLSTNTEAIKYLQPNSYWRNNRIEYYYERYKEYNWYTTITFTNCTKEELDSTYIALLTEYEINSKYHSFIEKNHFLAVTFLYESALKENLDYPFNPNYWLNDRYQQEIEQLQQIEAQKQLKAAKQERKKQLEPVQQALQSQLQKIAQEEADYNTLAAKGQFIFDCLLIQRQKNSTRFLLPNENNAAVTAYNIIERLSGKAFKSYAKQIKFKNDKIQMLPNSERLRLIFYFRQQYRKPLPLDNANTIAVFINTANKYTDNIELNQNWRACLDVADTQEEAASLLSYYGWAADYAKDYPLLENVFYAVDVRNGERHYNIVNDDITLRFAAIERKGRTFEASQIITDNKRRYSDKYDSLQSLLKPLLWWRDGIKMGLTANAKKLCDTRVKEYIEELLTLNAFDDITLEERINKVEIDKSNTGIVWAEPKQFAITIDDMEFVDYSYNINGEYNRKNNADKGKKKACEKYSRLIGDEWNTNELKAQGYTPQQIINYCNYNWIEEVPEKKKGNLKYYRRISR